MNLLWLDLETTGLDPFKHCILEVAVAHVTLEKPFDLGVKPCRPEHLPSWVVYLPKSEHQYLDPFILDMHTKNGLLAACSDASHRDHVFAVQEQLLTLVPEIADREERTVLAGASVHFDLSFLRVWMPELARRLSHRVYDTSAIKLFCQSLGMNKLPKGEAHRAAADVLESVWQAEYCAKWLKDTKGGELYALTCFR